MNLPPVFQEDHLPALYHALEHTLHPDPSIRQPAEKLLSECENIPQYSRLLLEILIPTQHQQHSNPSMRLIAIICLKNLVNKKWKARPGRQSSKMVPLADNEKQHIKATLIAYMTEPEKQIATQIAVTIAKIARMDWPAKWPELFSQLLQYFQQNSSRMQILRAMMTIKKCIKELASRRLLMHKKAFYQVAEEIFPVLFEVWKNHLACWICVGTEAPEYVKQEFELLKLSSKIIHHLIVNGFNGIFKNPALVEQLYLEVYQNQRGFLAFQREPTSTPVADQVEQNLTTLAKLVVATQKQYALEFQKFIGPFLELYYEETMNKTSTTVPTPSNGFLIHGLSYITNVVTCPLYQPSYVKKSGKVSTGSGDVSVQLETIRQIQAIIRHSFPNTRKQQLCQHLILNLMQLTNEDLEEWVSDPEGFIVTQESLTASESLRTSAEHLFLTLLQKNRPMLAPLVVKILSEHGTLITTATTKDEILRIDAILVAIGLGSYDLHDYLEFEPMFLQTLVPALQLLSQRTNHFESQILRRRILWVIGCWMVQLKAPMRPPLYDTLLQILVQDEAHCDMAVRLTALETLNSLLEDWEFQREAFQPFLNRVIPAAYFVIQQTSQIETRLKAMNLLEAVVRTSRDMIVPFVQELVAPLPRLWEAAVDQNLLRGHILTILAHVVTAVGDSSSQLYSLLLPVIHYATDVSQPDEVYLMETGLDLWTEIIHYAPTFTRELCELFENVILFLSRDYEHLKKGMRLIEGYVLLGRDTFWQAYHTQLAALFTSILGTIKPDAAAQVIQAIELIIRVYPEELLSSFRGVFGRIMELIALSIHDDLTKEPDMVVIGYLSLFGRLSLQAPILFQSILETSGRQFLPQYPAHDQLLGVLIDFYIDKYYSVVFRSVGPIRRKVWACALISFMAIPSEQLHQRLGQILEICADVIEEVGREEADSLMSSTSDTAAETEARRRMKLLDGDKIHQANLTQLCIDRLTQLQNSSNPTYFQALLQSVDQSVLAKFQL